MGFWIAIIGVVLCGALVWSAFHFQRRSLLLGAGLVLLLTGGLIALDQWIVTDEEAIVEAMQRVASAVSSNDLEASIACVSPEATECRESVRSEMPGYDFQYCVIRSIEPIEIDYGAEKPTAVVEFRVLADVRAPQYNYGGRVLRVVQLTYKQEASGEWLIHDYAHWEPPELQQFLKR